jgi:hypothetical protein
MKHHILLAVTALISCIASAALAANPHGGPSGSGPSVGSPSGSVGAGNPHNTASGLILGPTHPTGQPSQSCQVTTVTPGNAAGAPGSPFDASGHSGTVYAGSQPQNSKNGTSVAQYDVACANQTAHGH